MFVTDASEHGICFSANLADRWIAVNVHRRDYKKKSSAFDRKKIYKNRVNEVSLGYFYPVREIWL